MRIRLRKFVDVSPVIERDEKPCDKEEFGRGTVKSLTTLDFIGLVALTTFLPVLFLGRLIDEDNRHVPKDVDN